MSRSAAFWLNTPQVHNVLTACALVERGASDGLRSGARKRGVLRLTMCIWNWIVTDINFEQAIYFAKNFAVKGLENHPFDAVFRTTLEQIGWLESDIAAFGHIRGETAERLVIGIMAAKELGKDEADFAHALHVINGWAVDHAFPKNFV